MRTLLCFGMLLVFSAATFAHGAIFRGREEHVGPDGRMIVTQNDPFGLDTEETVTPSKLSNAEIISEALKLLPSLGCLGQEAAAHLAHSPHTIRFGPVTVMGRDGEKARGQVYPPEPGSDHAVIVIDESKPYLRDPGNAARIIAHEFIHDLQHQAALLGFAGGRVSAREDLHDPASADRVLARYGGQACQVSGVAKARTLILELNEALGQDDAERLNQARTEIEDILAANRLPVQRGCLEARLKVLSAQMRIERNPGPPYEENPYKKRVLELEAVNNETTSSVCQANVQALAMAIAGDLYIGMRWEKTALKSYEEVLRRATNPELISYAHRKIALIDIIFKGCEATEFWPHIEKALSVSARNQEKAGVLLEAGSQEARCGSASKALGYLSRAKALCRTGCSALMKHTIEHYRKNWTPDKPVVLKKVRKMLNNGPSAVNLP